MSCEPPFWENISIIFNNFSLEYKPSCKHSPYNFIARLLLLSLFVGLLGSVLGGLPIFIVTLLFGLITAGIIIFMTKPADVKEAPVNNIPMGYVAPIQGFSNEEGFSNEMVNGGSMSGSVQPYAEVDAYPYNGPMLPDYTPPKARNLFMNVLLDEIKYNPGRPEAAPVNNPIVKQTIDDYFRVQWFSDPTDVFGKNQSQRQFVTQPSTTVPNDQGSFADWLYRIPGKTCKEGGRAACLAGTDGGPVPGLNQKS